MQKVESSAAFLLATAQAMKPGASGPVLQLLGQYAEGAVRLAYHLTRDREQALDISQEAYVRAMQSLATLKQGENLRVWFSRIVVNLCRDTLRRRKVEQKGIDELRVRAPSKGDGPLQELENRETAEQLRAALMNLPMPLREAVVLVCVEGFTPQEAASMLGVPDGTLRSRLHEGRAEVRRWWSERDAKGDER